MYEIAYAILFSLTPDTGTVYRDSFTNRSNPHFKFFPKIKKGRYSLMAYVSGDKFNIRLTEDMKKWLFAEAERTGKTVSQIIREAIDLLRFGKA